MDYEEYISYNPILAKRAFAAIIDYVVFFILVYAYMVFFGKRQEDGTYYISFLSYHPFVLIAIWLAYFVAVESAIGYTLGKGAFDLKVIIERKEDDPIIASFKRHLLDPIDFFFTFGILAIVLASFTKGHKRLGDLFAHTRVIVQK
jgi:uncharacterized RDD family membrane protein YckC